MEWKKLLRPETLIELIANHEHNMHLKGTRREQDFKPPCKLFNPMGSQTWLISECDHDGLAFGLADLGFGEAELGYISLDELAELRLPGGLQIEEDLYFKPTQTLTQYADEARRLGHIKA